MSDQTDNDKDFTEATDRFKLAIEWESNWRPRFIADLKFRHADADNGWQWPDGIRKNRDIDKKPCLTMNLVRQHNLQISNDQRQRKSAIQVLPTGGAATAAGAKVIKGLIRYIEYDSDAQNSAYRLASDSQVDGGIGWWRLITTYCDNDTFDQKIMILPVQDALSVLIDGDAQDPLKKDARFGFVFDMVPKDQLTAAYHKLKDDIGDVDALLGGSGPFASWVKRDHVWIAEYFRKVPSKDQLLSFMPDGASGERKIIRKSMLPKEAYEEIKGHPLTQWRDVWDEKVEWLLIAGSKIIDRTDWPGKYIPLIPVIGEETIIDGQLDRKGHTRAMKDPQRMYNYNASGQVEFVAGQTKTPWLVSARAQEGFEEDWSNSNIRTKSVLLWNDFDEDFPEQAIQKPERIEPPAPSMGYAQGMEVSFNQMMMTSGQWQNQMGMAGNERTGKAIGLRQDQGDLATFHFPDNFGAALRFTGVQVIDLIPHVYVSQRVQKILADDGTEQDVKMDPTAKGAYSEVQDDQGEVIARVLNPQMGSYGVAAAVGPSWQNKQSETVDKLSLLMTQAPDLVKIVGDILMRNMDFDDAQEAARRLRRLVPPEALGEGPSQQIQQLQGQIGILQTALAKALEEQSKTSIKLAGLQNKTDITAYDAETRRMAALKDLLDVDPQGVQELVNKLVEESLSTKLVSMIDTADDAGDPAPVPGAKLAPDGEYYVSDKSRPGKYLRVKKRA